MQMLGLRLVVGLALLASSAAFHGPGLAMGPACKVGYLSGRADFPSRPLPAAAAKTKDEDGEELSEDDKKRRCVSRSGVLRAAVWALTASTVSAAYNISLSLSLTQLSLFLAQELRASNVFVLPGRRIGTGSRGRGGGRRVVADTRGCGCSRPGGGGKTTVGAGL